MRPLNLPPAQSNTRGVKRYRVDLPKSIYDILNSENIKKRYNASDIGEVLRGILIEKDNRGVGISPNLWVSHDTAQTLINVQETDWGFK